MKFEHVAVIALIIGLIGGWFALDHPMIGLILIGVAGALPIVVGLPVLRRQWKKEREQ